MLGADNVIKVTDTLRDRSEERDQVIYHSLTTESDTLREQMCTMNVVCQVAAGSKD